jgi:hypothetical protein
LKIKVKKESNLSQNENKGGELKVRQIVFQLQFPHKLLICDLLRAQDLVLG